MTGPPRNDLVHKAIRAGVLGNIQWQDAAARRVRNNPELLAWTPEGIRRLLRDFVLRGGTLDAREEARAEYVRQDPEHPYWHRAVIPLVELVKGLFVEVKLFDRDEDDPWVEIVNAHPQR
jgi:hypothetical protein